MLQPQITQNLDGSTTEYTDIPLEPGRLERLFRAWSEDIDATCEPFSAPFDHSTPGGPLMRQSQGIVRKLRRSSFMGPSAIYRALRGCPGRLRA
jgi:hypothetical protein